MDENEILAGLDDLASAAAEELAAESVPEVRRPGDVTLDEYIAAMRKRGVAFTNRRRAARWLLARVNVERVQVWDPLAQEMVAVYRKKADD